MTLSSRRKTRFADVAQHFWTVVLALALTTWSAQPGAYPTLIPGVAMPLSSIFGPLEPTSDIPFWSLGIFSYVDQPAPSYTISGGYVFPPDGTALYGGRPITGPRFTSGTDVLYSSLGLPQPLGGPYSSGSITVNADYTGTSITLPVVVLQGQYLTGGTGCYAPGVPCFTRGNVIDGSVTLLVGMVGDPPSASAPPTAANLASASDWIYDLDPQKRPAEWNLERLVHNTPAGFQAAMLKLTDGTRVVVVRGTDLQGEFFARSSQTNLSTWPNFPNLLGTSAGDALRTMVQSTAALVAEAMTLAAADGASVILTGHSLGGAVVQLVGAAGNLQTNTFNAPGTLGLLPGLSSELSAVSSSIVCASCVTNYRLFGDVVSQVGTQIGNVVTVYDATSDLIRLSPFPGAYAVPQHSITNMTHALNVTDGIAGFDYVPLSTPILPWNQQSIENGTSSSFTTPVIGDLWNLFDPAGFNLVTLTISDTGSPSFAGVVLPYLGETVDFEVETWSGSNWALDGITLGGVPYSFASGINKFRFKRTDGGLVPDGFLFYLKFDRDGVASFTSTAELLTAIPEPITTITIDIKPGSDPNSINLCSNGAVPVAILGSNTFDVSTINTETLGFAGAAVKVVGKKNPKAQCSVEDVNSDIYVDLVCHFVTADIAGINGESVTATVNGKLLDGTGIQGTDSVNVVKATCH